MGVNEKPSLEPDAKRAGSALVLDLTSAWRSLNNPRRVIWERRRRKLWTRSPSCLWAACEVGVSYVVLCSPWQSPGVCYKSVMFTF